MPSLAKVAWGLILVFVDLRFDGFDVVPDLVGWILVLAGITPLSKLSGWFAVAFWAGAAGLLAAVVQLLEPTNAVGAILEGSAQMMVCVGITTAVIAMLPDEDLVRRARMVRGWSVGLGLLGIAAVVLGPRERVEVDRALVPLLLVVVVAALALMVVWLRLLFALARHDPTPADPLAVP